MEAINTLGQKITLPEPTQKIMKAKVIAKTTVYNKPVEVGAVVEVDENTFRNLALKGRLAPADKDAEKVDVEKPSSLSKKEADARKAKAQEEADEKAAKPK